MLPLPLLTSGASGSPPTLEAPVVVLGFGKCGTTSLQTFFTCGGYRASHWMCGVVLCGTCIHANVVAGRRLFAGCGEYEVFAQIESTFPPDDCFYPQFDALELIDLQYPRSTWILNTRPFDHWLRSVSNWSDLRRRFVECRIVANDSAEAFRAVYNAHIARVRSFSTRRGHSHDFVEVDVESAHAARLLSRHFGINESCWRDMNSRLDQ